MSDEEKKAIKGLEWSQQQMRLGNLPDYDQGHYADIRIILNLIEKQSKEIEELTTNQLDLKDKCIKIAKKLEEDNKPFVSEYILAQIGACPVWDCGEPYSNYISKDKIKAKIEEVSKGTFDAKIVLQSLLEKE